jgi:hypothetical protein
MTRNNLEVSRTLATMIIPSLMRRVQFQLSWHVDSMVTVMGNGLDS